MTLPAAQEPRDGRELLLAYLGLVDELARANGHDPLWWATDAASKNRVRSPLLWLLNANSPAQAPGLLPTLRTLAAEYRRLVRRIRQARALFPATRAAAAPSEAHRPTSVIKSFAYPSSFGPEGFADPFFPGLAKHLHAICGPERRVVTLCLDFDDTGEVKRRMAALADPDLLPLEALLTPADAAKAALLALRGILRPGFATPSPLAFLGRDVSAAVGRSLRCGGGLPLDQLAHLAAAEALGHRYPVDHCVTTYEGNPWERMFALGLRRARPGVQIVGSQHSVVPQAAAGVFPGPSELRLCPLPDRVLTTGPATTRIILAHSAWPKERVLSGCAMRYGHLHATGPNGPNLTNGPGVTSPGRPPRRILAAPEGLDEAVDLVAYTLAQARLNPGLTFTLRTHPVLPLETFLDRLRLSLRDHPNVRRSTAPEVDQDVAECDVVLYWGSTVCLEALMRGVPVVHFDRGDRPSYDPLFEGCPMRWVVDAASPLAGVLDQIGRLGAAEFSHRAEQARALVRDYLHPVTPELMNRFLPSAHKAKEPI